MLLPVLAARAAAVVMVVVAAFQVACSAHRGARIRKEAKRKVPSTHPGACRRNLLRDLARDGLAILARVREGSLKGVPSKLVLALAWFTTIYAAVAAPSPWQRGTSERAVFAPTAILLFVLVVTVMVASGLRADQVSREATGCADGTSSTERRYTNQ